MSAYELALFLHSYVRWAVLGLAVVVTGRAWLGWSRARPWRPIDVGDPAERGAARVDEKLQVALLSFADLQLALGLLLWITWSPIARAFLSDPGHAVHDHVLRFFGLEHPTMMVVAVALLHIGRRRSKRGATSVLRHRSMALFGLAALLVVVSSIPWPGLRHGRPLFRGGSPPTVASPSAIPRSTALSAAVARCPPSYALRCAVCHGASGGGDGLAASSFHPPPRSFTARETWEAAPRTDAELGAIIHEGGATHGLNPAMPAQADLSKEDVLALVACIRGLHAAAAQP